MLIIASVGSNPNITNFKPLQTWQVEIWTHLNPGLATKTEIWTHLNPSKKPELRTGSARNVPNQAQIWKNWTFEPFQTQVHQPKPNYEPSKNPELRTNELSSTQH